MASKINTVTFRQLTGDDSYVVNVQIDGDKENEYEMDDYSFSTGAKLKKFLKEIVDLMGSDDEESDQDKVA